MHLSQIRKELNPPNPQTSLENFMKNLTVGHKYVLANFENPANGQTIQFIEKMPVAEGSKELRTVNDGTTNEEVLAMLIDRLKYLDGKFPCLENRIAIRCTEKALEALNQRTERRKKAGVEGKNAPVPPMTAEERAARNADRTANRELRKAEREGRKSAREARIAARKK